eukprot:CAMPEP_0115017188 /NCGR_PEP_ID=MMETSP0216-20121206/27948_1 /TAXON_ID=223996 /ORGANISM="Protocruzia adherens, Strain Boccale" /LENGTH=150 /DNA_ID=CAMNT_0002387917 /DNA_START=778 /DNA_END=1231 /DNA_ORIENTATION=+
MAGVVDYPRVFHPNAKDLISKLLTADRTKRYGCMKAGAEDVKKHKWFKGVDWEIVKSRGIPPPWIPNVKKLLTADRTKRYGCMKAGAEDVKKHKWFKGVDWEIVKSRGIPPPWIPNVKHPEDTHLFEEYPDSDEDFEGPSTEENKCFDDF